MAYIRVRDRKILEYMDNNYNVPKDWDKFIDSISDEFNLIIKQAKGKHFCTNCRSEFKTNIEIDRFARCPNCKKNFQVKRSNLKHWNMYCPLVLVNVVDSAIVFRLFELWFRYSKTERAFIKSNVEYGRIIEDKIYLNDRASKNIGYMYIRHIDKIGHWRLCTRIYGPSARGFIYRNNLKSILKDTKYKYSMVWNYAKHEKFFSIDDFFRLYNNYTNKVELLIKAKLYKLVKDVYSLEKGKTFKEIFNVPKEYYPFMKKYNINYKQLEILQILQECDIEKIRYLEEYNTDVLREISNYININKFIRYEKMHHGKIDEHMYKDYLKFAYFLGFDLKNKRYIYPDNLKQRHDELQEQFREKDNELINNMILNRDKELSHNTYQDKKYIVFPAPTLDSLIDESKQQNHCVRTYAKDYASGKCDIYFMRDVKKQDKSLVTIEVRKNKIIQKRIKNNKDPNSKQMAFLNEWEQNVLKKVA